MPSPQTRIALSADEDAMLDRLLVREGGYVDCAADPGGCTNLGITLDVFRLWRNRPDLTCRDLKHLTVIEAKAIYATRYLYETNIAKVEDIRLRELLLDYAVHSGPGRAIRTLQRVIGAEDDGDLGPKTLASLAAFDPALVYREVWLRRLNFLVNLALGDPSLLPFLRGWVRRISGLAP